MVTTADDRCGVPVTPVEPMTETIPAALAGERVDRAVSLITGRSRAAASELVAAGRVRIGGKTVSVRSTTVAEGDTVEIDLPVDPGVAPIVPDPAVATRFGVVYEDGEVIVVDKPAGMVVHPGAGNRSGTLVHGLLARYPDMAGAGDPARPGIVHRLDKGTSGLLVVARTPAAYASLVAQLADRSARREYLALVWGGFDAPRGMVDAPVGRSGRTPTRMAVSARGREARTRYEVERGCGETGVTLLRCSLDTGRTHQVRVHLAAIGHPVVGDPDYGDRRRHTSLSRPFLHAARLEFTHPASGGRMGFESPLPPDLVAVLADWCPPAPT